MTEKTKECISLGEAVASVDTPEGLARLKRHLESEPFPHFEQHPTVEGALIRIGSGRKKDPRTIR